MPSCLASRSASCSPYLRGSVDVFAMPGHVARSRRLRLMALPCDNICNPSHPAVHHTASQLPLPSPLLDHELKVAGLAAPLPRGHVTCGARIRLKLGLRTRSAGGQQGKRSDLSLLCFQLTHKCFSQSAVWAASFPQPACDSPTSCPPHLLLQRGKGRVDVDEGDVVHQGQQAHRLRIMPVVQQLLGGER